MALTFTVVDAFASVAFQGNPACVVVLRPDQQPSDKFLQDFAKEMNLSETAYLRKVTDGRYRLRWFTPAVEVDLCGHATLASAHFLFTGPEAALDTIEFTCLSGVLTVHRTNEGITMDFPAEPTKPLGTVPSNLAAALGLAESEILTVEENRIDWFIQVPNEDVVTRIQPDIAAIKEWPARCVVVTSQGTKHDVVSRVFGPRCGVNEDPVTGSAHCGLACFWSGRLNKTTMTAFQASARGGELVMTLKGDRVLLVGQSVAVTRGEYLGTIY